jgi:ComF family protein
MPTELLKRSWFEGAVRVGESILALVYPEVCAVCREETATRAEGYVCRTCQREVRLVRPPYCGRCGLPPSGEVTDAHTCANCRDTNPPFESARAAVVARGVVLDVIHRFKYGGETWFEPFLSGLLLRESVPELRGATWAGIVPVPLHPVKEREREFNQAVRLARPLSKATGIPLRTDLVRRVEPTATQTRLTREQRRDNVLKAFQPVSGARLGGGAWIVFDDVLTTGATAGAVAQVLLDLGAERVVVWSVARATLDGPGAGPDPG